MRRLIWPVLFLLCLSLQMSLPQNQWFKFDLPLLLIYCLAMLKGAFAGGIAGFFVGLLQDLLTGGIFGFHILTRTAIGYYVGYTKEKVFKEYLISNGYMYRQMKKNDTKGNPTGRLKSTAKYNSYPCKYFTDIVVLETPPF